MPLHMVEMTMNSQGSCPAANSYSVDPGDGGGGAAEGFLGMFGDRRSSGDLFDVVRQGGAGGSSSSTDVQPCNHFPSSSLPAAVAPPQPAWEDEMAAWLYPVVRGDELVFTGQDDHSGELAGHSAAVDDQQAADHKREDKLPKMEEKCRAEDLTISLSLRKKATGGVRKSHSAETHNLTEKRRRCKINDKLKTLQQLVPGCDKSNQISTLDQTIQYLKLLQEQIQAMSFGCGVKPAAVVYPVMPSPYLPPAAAAGLMPPAAVASEAMVREQVRRGVVLASPPPAMLPFGPLLPLMHHPAVVHASASAPSMLYPPAAAAPSFSVAAAAAAPSSARQNNST